MKTIDSDKGRLKTLCEKAARKFYGILEEVDGQPPPPKVIQERVYNLLGGDCFLSSGRYTNEVGCLSRTLHF